MKKFIILTTQRTGSTLLWQFLNLHPQIDGHGEVFLKMMKREDSFNAYINGLRLGGVKKVFFYKELIDEFFIHLENHAPPETRAIGFKLMYNQLNPKLKSYLIKNDFGILHLIRKNYLKIIISRESAQKRSFYHAKKDNEIEKIKVDLNTNLLLQALDQISAEVDKCKNEFSSCNYQEVFYEDFVSDRKSESLKILQFLNLPDLDLGNQEFPLMKINSDKLPEIIENYSNVESLIRNSKYSEFL
jgi:LPS sulfotransferase NodH